jgi:type II secretory pathway predicted ATPase ExeA
VSIRAPWDSQFERNNRAEGSGGTALLGPVPHEAKATGLTYEPFYGLKEKPFSLTSDSRFFYHSRSHAPAFDDLLAGIRRRESLNVLTGDIGTGKTTLCRAVLQNLDRKTFSAFVPDPFASREDLLKVLLMDFGVASVDDLTSGRLRDASRTELSYLLYEFLGTLAPLQAFAVVIIDEAQNLSIPLLEEIRILSDADGQLQVVLVGQLELRHKLKLPEMRQVDQRVSVHCHLAPLECDGVAGYVAHRLQTAGGSPDRVRFSPEAIEGIYRVSGGVPRLINRLCDRALYQGHLRRAATIDREILEAAVPEAVQFVAAARAIPGLVAAPIAHVTAPVPVAAVPEPAPSVAPVPDMTLAEAPAPAGWPQQYPDPVDEWLAFVDAGATAAEPAAGRVAPAPRSADVARPDRLIPLYPQPAVAPDLAAEKPRVKPAPRSHVQQTYMERFTRRWLRRAGVATLALMTLGVALVGAPSLMALSTDLWTRSTEWLAEPATPDLPVAPPLHLAPAVTLPPPVETLPPADVVAGEAGLTGVDGPK